MNTEPTNKHDMPTSKHSEYTLNRNGSVREKAKYFLQQRPDIGKKVEVVSDLSSNIANNAHFANVRKTLEGLFNQNAHIKNKSGLCANNAQETDLNHHQNQLICDSTTSSSSMLSHSSNNHIPIAPPLLSNSFLQNKSHNNLPEVMLDAADRVTVNSKSQDIQVKDISTQNVEKIDSIIVMLEQLKRDIQLTTSSVSSEYCVDSDSAMIAIGMHSDTSCSDI